MSLTSFITHGSFKELRDKFKTTFPKPGFNVKAKLLAPPLTSNYSVIGQSFDYLLRFHLEHRHKNKITERAKWVAEYSYETIINRLLESESDIVYIGRLKNIERNKIDFVAMLIREFGDAKMNCLKYLKSGKLTSNLIKSALFLARLDVYARVGMIDPNLGNESKEDIKDLLRLMNIIEKEHFKVLNHCFLNPTFGRGSALVGGADADLVIDDTLIEIKVTKKLSLERNYLNQAIGYYILSMVGGINGSKKVKPIKNIGIYYARHGVLWKVPLSELATKETLLNFKNWFVNYADEKIWMGRFSQPKKVASEAKSTKTVRKNLSPKSNKTPREWGKRETGKSRI